MEITFQPSFTGLYQTDSHTSSWTCSVRQRKGTPYMPSALAQPERGGCKGGFKCDLETIEVLPILNLTTLETERGGWHSMGHVVPSVVPSEILRVGGEAVCRVGWYFSFMQIHHCWNTLPFIRFEIPKGKCCLLSLLCLMSNTLWLVNKRHIVFLLLWMRMTFSHESCLLQFLSKTHKVHTFPKKGHC